MPSSGYERIVKQVDGLTPQLAKIEASKGAPLIASGVEFILEGLHLNKRLNKDRVGQKVQYRG